jgi:hypothetical protein
MYDREYAGSRRAFNRLSRLGVVQTPFGTTHHEAATERGTA